MISPSGSVLWECVCDCGNIVIVSSNSLRSNGTISCGCISSKNEMIIRQHLDKLNIKYNKQYWFDDLRSPITGYVLRFDVAVFDKDNNLSFLIEYDGELHEYVPRFCKSKEKNEEKFKRTKLYDKLKNEYCEKNNIDLIRISFRDKERLIEIVEQKLIEKGLI